MKKKSVCIMMAMALAISTVFSGCGSQTATDGTESSEGSSEADAAAEEESSETEEAAETVVTDRTTVPAPTDYISDEVYAQADYWPSCDDTRLANVMKKAASGEAITVACIGGSITQGTISNGDMDSEVSEKKTYAQIFNEWFTETFPNTEINFVNAGIGGTDSYLGVHRLKKDVLSYNPDLVLVEFSVNDSDSEAYKKSYDNLVRNVLNYSDTVAVMLLFMAQTNGSSAQGSHVFVGYNYSLPMISYANVIKTLMDNGDYTDKNLSGDTVHPSALGHAITGEILWKYLNSVYEVCDSFGEDTPFDANPVTKTCYENADLLDADSIEADSLGSFETKPDISDQYSGWICQEGDGEIEFTASFRNLGILYLATTDGLSGKFDIYVDGECVHSIDADFSGGWGNAITATEVYTSDEAAEHTIMIKKSADSTGDVFKLLGLLVS